MEAEHDHQMRQCLDLFESGNLRDTLPKLHELLKSDNPYLRVMAASNICASYQGLGMQADLEKSFKLLLEMLEDLPPDKGFSGRLLAGLRSLSENQHMLGKASLTPESQKILQQIFTQGGITPPMTAAALGQESSTVFEDNIPGLSSIKEMKN
jgi:hypothetical protein